jgi:hypothetical protein
MANPEVDLTLSGDGQLTIDAKVSDTTQAAWDHEARCGCVLPTHRGETPVGAEQKGLGGWFGIGMNQPSHIQNRTTEHPFSNARQRHPTNPIKQLTILTWQAQNPDNWPDGNPINPPRRRED